MDVSEALRLPGVADVITAADIPGQKVRMLFGYEEELLASRQVESECVRLTSMSMVATFKAQTLNGHIYKRPLT